ncbi:LacI family transcriptional regulator [Microbacterium terrae]|uniref:HTH-type transcriptional repressor PurR n=1 Tax=Microbacterium terrae TaxID=69369 RepID=A0A0M2HJJ0_9MICO|nr:LacI family DNA-binding transcriptional regulator [Microbacterium terrae]KJL44528.1 HTH-type transcriptional repressor PurR [Microbacterium terrae]MBP1079469.1 LacI family transcriptional regulator [Microbacterium terrae]GLJ96810.1 LacI family transcriptional regulator [Microbacterium terrae]
MSTPATRRRPSMDDVAKAAGVSKGAVSKVIRDAYGVSPEMRQRVEATIRELGYRPRIAARAMRGSSFSIGLEIPNLDSEFFTQIMKGAASQLSGTNYQLMIAPGLGELSGTPVLENLADRQVDGIIAISPEVTPEWLEELSREVPVVLLGRHDKSASYDTITNDDEAGTRLALDHLLGLGHRRIAHLTLRMKNERSDAQPPHTVRRLMYERVTADAGLEPLVVYSDLAGDGAYLSAKELLVSDPRITAIFAGNDTLAIESLRAIADLGLTAEDVSVIGYDDIRMAGHPLVSLSTIDQFGEAMGRAAIDLLMERIRGGRTEPRHRELEPKLRVRASTRPASPTR